jgi:hypothetical protein
MMASQIETSREPFFKPFKGPKVTVRTPLRKESEKRQEERAIYSEKRKAYLETHTFCEFDGCTRIATDIHHKARRGANYLDESTFFAACRVHHRWIHGNPAEAREMGLLV